MPWSFTTCISELVPLCFVFNKVMCIWNGRFSTASHCSWLVGVVKSTKLFTVAEIKFLWNDISLDSACYWLVDSVSSCLVERSGWVCNASHSLVIFLCFSKKNIRQFASRWGMRWENLLVSGLGERNPWSCEVCARQLLLLCGDAGSWETTLGYKERISRWAFWRQILGLSCSSCCCGNSGFTIYYCSVLSTDRIWLWIQFSHHFILRDIKQVHVGAPLHPVLPNQLHRETRKLLLVGSCSVIAT